MRGRRGRLILVALALLAVIAALAATALLRRDAAGPGAPGGSGANPAVVVPRFVEETATAGVDHAYDGEFEFFVGGGVAVFDCDDDGRPELYLAGGSQPAGLYRNRSEPGAALRFVAAPDAATDLDRVVGAYPIDVDADGMTDIAVLRSGENVMLRGLGDCRFERANERWNIDGGDAWTAAFSATWETPDGRPTLAFGNYLELDRDGSGRTVCDESELVRPEPGESGGAPSYGGPVALTPGYCTLSVLFSDWSRTGARDLRVSNDRHYSAEGEEQLWRVAPGERPRLYSREEGWQPVRIWGMGIASQDVTGDGLPEVFLTSQGDNKLQTLADGGSQPRYEDIALRRGATAHRPFAGDTTKPSTAWHAEFEDVNNDGVMDLFVAKGNVEAQPEYASLDPSNLLLGRADGTFVESTEAAGLLSMARARGAAVADLNVDGLLDLVVVNRRESVKLWRNVGSGTGETPAPLGSSLAIRLTQSGGNRDAIGAWVEARTAGIGVVRELTIGGGHAGGQLGWLHFGLGGATTLDLRVTWPDGEVETWQGVTASGYMTLERGGDPMPWSSESGS